MSTKKEYITDEGYRKVREELDNLFRVERPRVVKGVADAAAEGDRSENAEYIFGKKKLRELDRRWRFLSQRLARVQVVDGPPPDTGVVRFGASVDLVAGTRRMTVTLVGEDEIDPVSGRISLRSPLGQALLGMPLGGETTVTTPRGPVVWTVEAIRYA